MVDLTKPLPAADWVQASESDTDRQAYLDGIVDSTGHVDAPVGHWYRVDERLIHTDTQGFRTTYGYATENAARTALLHLEREYVTWLGDDPDQI